MRHLVTTFFVSHFVLVAGLLSQSPAAITDSELARFQGDWRVVELVDDGKVIPKEAIRNWLPSGGRAQIIENAIIFSSPQDGKKHAKVFSIDVTRSPKGIEVSSKEKRLSQGIYRFDNDRLTVCFSDPKIPIRPNDFSAAAGSRRMLMVLSRDEQQSPPTKQPAPQPEPNPKPATQSPAQTGVSASVITDDQARSLLVGSWKFKDGLGPVYAVIHGNGTFYTARGLQKSQIFQQIFLETPISSGTWSLNNGQLTYYVSASTYPERAGRTVALYVRSITHQDLIFVDALGRVGAASKVQ